MTMSYLSASSPGISSPQEVSTSVILTPMASSSDFARSMMIPLGWLVLGSRKAYGNQGPQPSLRDLDLVARSRADSCASAAWLAGMRLAHSRNARTPMALLLTRHDMTVSSAD